MQKGLVKLGSWVNYWFPKCGSWVPRYSHVTSPLHLGKADFRPVRSICFVRTVLFLHGSDHPVDPRIDSVLEGTLRRTATVIGLDIPTRNKRSIGNRGNKIR